MEILKRTALFDEHVKSGARLVPFAGWEMPVQYEGVIPEVRAVREGCGIFDVSHMGQLDFNGAKATTELNQIVSADWSETPIGRVAYALLLNETGGVIDDVMGYRLAADEWLVVVNASRADADEAHFKQHLAPDVTLNKRRGAAMIAIQGTRAADVLQTLTDLDLTQVKWRDCVPATICGANGILARGGYTGCDGFEFMFDGMDASRVWNALLQNGAVPCGLGARDVLRLEAGLPLYGHELREDWTPLESGVGFAAKIAKPEFLGRAALLEKQTPSRRIRALKMQSKAIPREGYAVLHLGAVVGEITSGTMSPALNIGIALAMLPSTIELGDIVEVQVRSATHSAEVVPLPFVAHGRK